MIDCSAYTLEPLNADGELVLYRGWLAVAANDGRAQVLVVAPSREHASPLAQARLEHEASLTAELDPRWAARPLQLGRYHGRTVLVLEDPGGVLQLVGPPFDLTLPPRTLPLRRLPIPLRIRFTVLEEKFVGRTVHEGQLTALCELAAVMESEPTPVVLSNLRITVAATLLGNPAGEIYAKAVEPVAGTPARVKIRFSSVTPELKSWMRSSACVVRDANAG